MTSALLLLATVALTGCAATLALTPPIRKLARARQLVDLPDHHRKLHDRPIPLGGGIVVLLGCVLAVALALVLPHPWRPLLWQGAPHLLGLLIAALVLIALGLVDDCFSLSCRNKILGQLVAALVIIAAGLHIERLEFFGWQIELGMLAIPFTVFWILGAINALNLLDGSDGVATTVGIVICLALAAMALMLSHREVEAVVALALAGSLIGFLVYNFPPASVYLGDAGSMLIGLIIGVLALRSGLKAPATVALATPTAIFAIPILDTVMAILRRTLTGRSVYSADRGHLHHCLLRRGLSRRRTVASIAGLCAATAFAALASLYHRNEALALIGTLSVAGTLMVTRCFGHAESRLLTGRMAQCFGRLFRTPAREKGEVFEHRVFAEKGCRWEALWDDLIELADRHDVCALRLNVSVPSLGEEFHAFRHRNVSPRPNDWQLDLPLMLRSEPIGRLLLRGRQLANSSRRLLSEFVPRLDELLSNAVIDPSPLPKGNPSEMLVEVGTPRLVSTVALVKDLDSPPRSCRVEE